MSHDIIKVWDDSVSDEDGNYKYYEYNALFVPPDPLDPYPLLGPGHYVEVENDNELWGTSSPEIKADPYIQIDEPGTSYGLLDPPVTTNKKFDQNDSGTYVLDVGRNLWRVPRRWS